MAKRKRRARAIAESLIQDRLEVIEHRMEIVKSMTEEEAEFVMTAYKIMAEAEQSDAEVEMLRALDTKQSNLLDEAIIEIEALNVPKDKEEAV